jgi:hypothetical protein
VEASIASYHEKKQVILVPPGKRPARMLAGLPGLLAIDDYSRAADLIAEISRDSDSAGGNEARLSPTSPMPAPTSVRPDVQRRTKTKHYRKAKAR